MAEKFIQGAIKHPGALHKELGVPQGQKIPAAKLEHAAHAGGKLGQRARFAMTLKGLHHHGPHHEMSHHSGEMHIHHHGGNLHVHHSDGKITTHSLPHQEHSHGAPDVGPPAGHESGGQTQVAPHGTAAPAAGNVGPRAKMSGSKKGIKSMADLKKYAKEKHGL